jgi:PEP-CTERM motif
VTPPGYRHYGGYGGSDPNYFAKVFRLSFHPGFPHESMPISMVVDDEWIVVPEPATWLLVAIALAAFTRGRVGRRWMRK